MPHIRSATAAPGLSDEVLCAVDETLAAGMLGTTPTPSHLTESGTREAMGFIARKCVLSSTVPRRMEQVIRNVGVIAITRPLCVPIMRL